MRLERHFLADLCVSFGLAALTVYFVSALGTVVTTFSLGRYPLVAALSLAPLLLCSLSQLLTPLAFLVGVLFTYGRLAADNEFLATRACGIHPWRVLSPVVLLGLLLAFAQLMILSFVIPSLWVHREEILQKLALRTLSNIEPSVTHFELPGAGLSLDWVDRIRDNEFGNVVLRVAPDESMHREAYKGQAERVRIDVDRDVVRLVITNFRSFDPKSQVEGKQFSISFSLRAVGGEAAVRAKPNLLPTDVLLTNASRARRRYDDAVRIGQGASRDAIHDFKEWQAATFMIHRRAAWSFDGLLFGIVGAPIAIWLRRGTRLTAILVALGIVFLLYFPLSKFADAIADRPEVPPWISAWMATATLLALGTTLLVRLARQ